MDYLIALLIGFVVFRFLRNSISSLASIPPELDTDDVVEISQSFSCNKCGTPVSYTHLRAHETSQDLVCRLLLEKKK